MKLNISSNEEILLIDHNDQKKFTFNINNTVDLNDFIKYVSESETKIESTPKSFEDFSGSYPNISKEMMKLIEYIYKIISAYNDSYTEVYIETKDDDSITSNTDELDDNGDLPF
jgi:hypothetical protein